MEKNISIKDKPVETAQEDQLKVERYTKALANFILKSDTPITVGLQGEWGTGKTSMMYMLRELLEKQNVATSWVNTWEYSMFRGAKETTPAVLNGLLATLEKSCGNAWKKEGETDVKMKKIGRFFGNLANQIVANQVGIDIQSAATGINTERELSSRAEIAEIKSDISEIIDRLIKDQDNHYQRVVFFIDDLDRINPTDAVEVLEALKNMFDINHCIFVLAIDYEVVVKGLEGKFGKKTEENEREFRSFFDKIIQVPFSMPTGAYDIDYFLDEKLKELGLQMPDDLKQLYVDVVKNSVGYNPRSLKRFINTFSLLNTIRKSDEEENKDQNQAQIEVMLFAMLGIQISYPKIFRYIGMNPEYKDWNQATAAKFGLDWVKLSDRIKEYGENSLTNDDWEKVVWGLCQSDSYLKSRAFSILELLNLLNDHFKNNLDEVLQRALEFAAITSVDDSHESKQNLVRIGESKMRFAGVEAKKQQLIDKKCQKSAVDLWERIFTTISKYHPSTFPKINYAMTATSVYRWTNEGKSSNIQTLYCENPSQSHQGLKISIYGYNNSFIEDMIMIAKGQFMRPIEPKSLQADRKAEIFPGVTLYAPQENWKLATYGYLVIEQGFFTQPKHTTDAFIDMVINTMIAKLNT
jgi:hypothetical protein